MRVLKLNENYLSLCGLFPDKPGESNSYKMLKRINFGMLWFGTAYLLIATSGVYAYQNIDSMTDATNAFIVFTGGIAVFGGFISYAFNKEKIQWLHHEFQEIVDKA